MVDWIAARVRKKARVDANQSTIVKYLRDIPGMSVVSLANTGGGVPDLLVGFRGNNFLFEIKDPEKIPSQRKLTPAQKEFHATWSGQVDVAETFGEILNRVKERT